MERNAGSSSPRPVARPKQVRPFRTQQSPPCKVGYVRALAVHKRLVRRSYRHLLKQVPVPNHHTAMRDHAQPPCAHSLHIIPTGAPAPGPAQALVDALDRRAAEARLGLSQAHISTQALFTLAVGGRIARVSHPSNLHIPRPVAMVPALGPKQFPNGDDDRVLWVKQQRGKVKGFSRQSRSRLMQRAAAINVRDMKHLPVLLTLTYPNDYPDDPAVYKRHLDAFHTALVREYGKVGTIWKLEFQRRGAAHFHLMPYFKGDTGHTFAFRQWCKRTWYRIVGSGDEKHVDQGAQVTIIQSVRGVQSYMSKYVAKPVEDVEQNVGRWWGVWHAEALPVELVRVALTEAEFYRMRRVFAGVRRSHRVDAPISGRNTGMWLFLAEEEARRALRWLIGGGLQP